MALKDLKEANRKLEEKARAWWKEKGKPMPENKYSQEFYDMYLEWHEAMNPVDENCCPECGRLYEEYED